MAKLTKQYVEKLPPAPDTSVFHFDDDLKGFGVRVSGNAKTFIVQAWIKDKKVRSRIGRFGVFTVEQARKEAQRKLGEMAGGTNPNDRKRKSEGSTVTLRQLFDEYKESRAADGGLRPKTLKVYESALRRCYADWLDRPAVDITKDMVVDRFRAIATTKGPRSKESGARAQASQAMRILRTLLNFGGVAYEDVEGTTLFPPNPVPKLSQTHRGWSKVAPKDDIIDPADLHRWYLAVQAAAVRNQTVADFLLLCLFTGLRRSAASQLKWTNVNLRTEIVNIPLEDDKTGRAFRLPMSKFVHTLLKRRHSARGTNEFVFQGEKPATCIQEPKGVIAKVVGASGVKFSTHTLRKTFATTAERLDISYYKLKHLLNHSLSGDVTGNHYVRVDVEQLREPMEKIAAYLEQRMNEEPKSEDSIADQTIAIK